MSGGPPTFRGRQRWVDHRRSACHRADTPRAVAHLHLATTKWRWTTARWRWGSSVLDLADDRAVGDGGADLGLEAGDGAGLVGLEGLLHLHRLHDDDGVALGDRLALLDDD